MSKALEINWEFDVKDLAVAAKYGNFSSPTLIKLVSKYNKTLESQSKSEVKAVNADAKQIS